MALQILRDDVPKSKQKRVAIDSVVQSMIDITLDIVLCATFVNAPRIVQSKIY